MTERIKAILLRNEKSRLTSRVLMVLAFLCTLSGVQGAVAQDDDERREDAEVLFQQGIEAYDKEDFRAATTMFDRLVRTLPFNHRTTAAHVMKGKAQLMQGESLEATRTLRAFVGEYPTSSYIPDAEYTLGLALVRASRFESAVEYFLRAWRGLDSEKTNPRLWNDIVATLDAVIDSSFNVVKLSGLLTETEGKDQRGYLWLKIAEMNARNASLTAAEAALDTITRKYPATPFPARIALVRDRIEQRGAVKIGVLLPLMKSSPQSSTKEIGTDLLRGIELAAEEYNRNPSVRVKVVLDIRDTDRDPLVATRLTQDLTSDPEVIAIVGPVFSNTASAVVGLANARGVPLVTPTANSNGIAAVGPYIFQANPDYDTRGIAMARFAVQRLGYRTLAVLAPIDTYAKFMADAFSREALRLGAEIIATEWYQRGATDFNMQLRNIRKAGLLHAAPPVLSFSGNMSRETIAGLVHLGVPMETVDSLLERSAEVDAEKLLGPRAKYILDSLGISAPVDESRLDSLELPVPGIDGMYVPIGMPEEIGVVASQIVYFNIKTGILGSGEWNSFPELDANKRYCTNVHFDSDTQVDSSNPEYADFMNRFFERYQDRPGKNTLYGYDTMSLLLDLIQSGASQRSTLASALSKVTGYRGYHSRIGFSPGRVNVWLSILRFDGERIIPVEEMAVQ